MASYCLKLHLFTIIRVNIFSSVNYQFISFIYISFGLLFFSYGYTYKRILYIYIYQLNVRVFLPNLSVEE